MNPADRLLCGGLRAMLPRTKEEWDRIKGFNDFADSAFQSDEEGVGAIHAGVAQLLAFGHGGAAQDHNQSQNEYENFLHCKFLLLKLTDNHIRYSHKRLFPLKRSAEICMLQL